jgi:hypothetical protein
MKVRSRLAGMDRPPSGPHASGPGISRRNSVTAGTLTAVFAASLLTVVACASPGAPPTHDHGFVAAHLTIPFRPVAAAVAADIIPITVSAGQRFSIKVETSDGPYFWSQEGTPDPRLIRLVGDFNEGNCAPAQVGCRVPYFRTLVARARGATTMSWKYHDLSCAPAPRTASPPSGACTRVTTVTLDITIR